MPAPIVFFDIAGPDASALGAFYGRLFDWEVAPDGRFSAPAVQPLPATFRSDPAETLLYIGVPDIDATLAEVSAHGGGVELPRFVVPGVVVLAIFRDPAGNRMGLVELDGDRPKLP